jgi:aerobic carbon-monoxide dehydrogenase small subunit
MALVTMTVNGRRQSADVEDRTLLVHLIRDNLGLTGAHVGCDTSQCGACTVLLDGAAVKSCAVFAVQASGAKVTTVEGLAPEGSDLHVLQQAFHEEHGLQCGFCTPGMLLTLHDYLRQNPDPTTAEVRHALSGNICRCTGYQNIVSAALLAAKMLREAKANQKKVLS